MKLVSHRPAVHDDMHVNCDKREIMSKLTSLLIARASRESHPYEIVQSTGCCLIASWARSSNISCRNLLDKRHAYSVYQRNTEQTRSEPVNGPRTKLRQHACARGGSETLIE